MKKFSSVLLALVMMVALCIPAFAGTRVDALEEGSPAKEIALLMVEAKETAGIDMKDNLLDFASYVIEHIKDLNVYKDEAVRTQAVTAAVEAVQGDYMRLWGYKKPDFGAFKDHFLPALEEAANNATQPVDPSNPSNPDDPTNPGNTDSDLGISTFDPSGALDNIVDGITDNDLSGLFGTLRNTINDLSGRLSGVFSGLGGGNNGDDSNNGGNGDDSFGGSEPTGDTAIYAVAGVAAVAAAALIFTKKKSEKAE